jgi:hypothetical protein
MIYGDDCTTTLLIQMTSIIDVDVDQGCAPLTGAPISFWGENYDMQYVQSTRNVATVETPFLPNE